MGGTTGARRVAAIDCGTNTIKLLITDLDRAAGTSRDLVRKARMVRLGEGVDRTGRLSETALVRVFAAIDEYAALIDDHAAEAVRFCATSAARDSSNADEFAAGVRARLQVDPEVLPGIEEAALSYAGATRALTPMSGVVQPPYLVVDIGGGSTELILGDADGSVIRADSLDIGSVRMTERHLHGDPPTPEEVAAATADIEAALDGCAVDPGEAAAVIGVAGTITTTAAVVLGLAAYDRTILHHAVVSVGDVQATARRFLQQTVEQRRELPPMHPGRADVIAAGALILDRVLRRAEVPSLLVSETDILDGIAWSLS